MRNYKSTSTFLRCLIHLTFIKPLIGEDVLQRIEQSHRPFNPVDSDRSEHHCAYRKGFDNLLTQGVDWHSIQLEAAALRRTLA